MRSRIIEYAAVAIPLAAAATATLLTAAGCGSAMGPSSFGWNLTRLAVSPSSSNIHVGDSVSLEATYYAEVPAVNPSYFTGQSIGVFNAEWSEVPSSPGAAPHGTFASPVGDTTTSYGPNASPNVRVNGDSSNTIQFSQAGAVTVRLHVNFQASDGSRHSKDFDVTLNVLPPAGT